MSTRIKKRREHRKLNNIRLQLIKNQSNLFIWMNSHQIRLFAQTKKRWAFPQKLIENVAKYPVIEITRVFDNIASIHNYKKEHTSVQNLIHFYNPVKRNQLRFIIKNSASFYRNQVRINTRNDISYLVNGKSLSNQLEARLVTALWRSFLVGSIEIRRVIISHGYVLVNNKTIWRPSYALKPGDLVTVKSISKSNQPLFLHKHLINTFIFRCPPRHLEVSFSTTSFVFGYSPFFRELSYPFHPNLLRAKSFFNKG